MPEGGKEGERKIVGWGKLNTNWLMCWKEKKEAGKKERPYSLSEEGKNSLEGDTGGKERLLVSLCGTLLFSSSLSKKA